MGIIECTPYLNQHFRIIPTMLKTGNAQIALDPIIPYLEITYYINTSWHYRICVSIDLISK